MPHNRRRLLLIAVLLLLLALGGLAGFRPTEARQARAEELTAELTGAPAAPLPPAERRNRWRELYREVGRLPGAGQQAFWAGRRRAFRGWLEDFFRAPRREQVALLDQEIDRMAAFRREHSSAPAGWSAGESAEELDRRQRQWLDLTTPAERALVGAYLEMLSQRGQQRGGSGCPSPWGDVPT